MKNVSSNEKSRMTEQKQQQHQSEKRSSNEKSRMTEQKQHQHQSEEGLFPFKVKKFLSGVASAGQAALREAQELKERSEGRKPPLSVSSSQKSGDTKSSREKQKEKLTTPPTSPPASRNSIVVSPGFALDIAKDVIEQPNPHCSDNDWELLSTGERTSNNSGVFVSGPRSGSVRSITSLDQDSNKQSTLSVPFKIQRTNSSSTIDSQDNVLGPSGKGILGVDYVEHVCLPTDTIQGICIAYKVSASQLRRANHFTGTLHSAPKKLLIPLSKQALRTGFIRVQDTDSKEYKLHYFQAEFPDISATEARGYLELADWQLSDALKSAKEDWEWESDVDGEIDEKESKSLKSGQIGIKVGFNGKIPTINLRGTGHASRLLMKKSKKAIGDINKIISKNEEVEVHSRPPAIASKSVLAEDLYKAAPQHESYGFELQPITKRNQ